MAFTRQGLEQYANKQRGRFEELLKEFVEIPSVSAEPDRKQDLERCAELGLETVRAFGGKAEIHRVPDGPPVVHGTFGAQAKGRRTVTIYNHLDVVPASADTEPWRTEPFTFTKEGDTYFGRGTTDDKGPALSALYGARAALEAGVPVNIKVLWELEEEVGSPNFADTLKAMGSAAATDAVIVSDTVWVSRDRPALSAGLRGLQTLTFTLETAETDRHSGLTGGVARNPVAELCQIAGEIFDARTGRVKVPGFYDDVEKLTKTWEQNFKKAGFRIADFKKAHALHSVRTKDPFDALKRLWALPTFEVHGLVGGYVGPGVKTVVPPRAELKVSMRLVPNMNGQKIAKLIQAYVRKKNPDIKVDAGPTAPSYKGVTTGPYVESAQRAVRFAFGKDPVFVREGGTIGAILFMEQILKCPIVFIGLSLPEHGYHAPNENFDWHQAGGGMVVFAKFLEEVAAH
jgi:acetylornithine deacetylase/succinyl-diaminopimelate desuccinylase-like protein